MNNYIQSFKNNIYEVALDTTDAFRDVVESYSSDSHYEDFPEQDQQPFSGKALKGIQSFELFKILNSYSQPKVLVLEKEISEPLFRCIASIAELRAFNVKEFYHLNDAKINKNSHHYVYLFRPTNENIDALTKILNAKKSDENIHTVYFIPSFTDSKIKLIDQKNYHCIGDFNLQIFPMADNLLSMEQPKILKTTREMDTDHIHAVAMSISQLQKVYGTIPNIQFLGKNAKKLAEIINETPHLEVTSDSIFARITIFDRTEDLLTPCFTPMTFESRMDELFGITGQVTEVEKQWIMKDLHEWLKIKPEDEDSKKIPISLDNEVYSQLKNINLYKLGEAFDSLKMNYEKNKTDIKELLVQAKETGSIPAINMAQTMASENTKNINQIALYNNLATSIMNAYNASIRDCEENITLGISSENTLKFIESAVSKKTPINQILKLLSLFSQVHGAITPERFQKLALSMLNSYGHTSPIALSHLKKSGMLSTAYYKEKNRQFYLNKNHKKYKDISNFYGGYSPLSCRHIEKLLRFPLTIPHEGLELIVFLGGCTRAEASACQLISKKAVVFTTALFTSNSFMDTLLTQNNH